jgi:hypothetical protein
MRWKTRLNLQKRFGLVLHSRFATTRSQRAIVSTNRHIDHEEIFVLKAEENELRARVRLFTARWHPMAKDYLLDELKPFLKTRQRKIYRKIQRTAGCHGWELKMRPGECVVVDIASGCSAFPAPPKRDKFFAWERGENWDLDVNVTRKFVREEIIPKAREKLLSSRPPDPFVNLTERDVPEDVKNLINKGLSFIPNTGEVEKEVKSSVPTDVARFGNNIRWKQYHYEKDENGETRTKDPAVEARLKTWPTPWQPSGREAPRQREGPIKILCEAAERLLSLKKLAVPTPTANTSKETLEKLLNLASDPEIVFVEADKGSGAVLMKREELERKIEEEILSDRDSYEELTKDPTKDLETRTAAKWRSFITRGLLTKEEVAGLEVKAPKLPRMFSLVKLHKQGYPLRPVVSNVDSVLSQSAHLIDNKVKPVLLEDPRYLRDTKQLLRHIEAINNKYQASKTPWKKVYAVSFDVVAFYPSVPHDLARTAFDRALDKMELAPGQGEALKECLDMNLENAFFTYNDRFFRQKTGLPIGSAIGGPIACLALAQEEEKLAKKIAEEKPHLKELMDNYVRYQDDGASWLAEETLEIAKSKVTEFRSELEGMNSAFRFTDTGPVKQLPVLDVLVMIDDEQGIKTNRYSKPTDKRTLLDSTSDHPDFVKSAVAKGVGLRMRRLASEEEWLMKNLVEEAWVLLGRGHDESWIVEGFAKALTKSRTDLLEEKEIEDAETQKFDNEVRCIVPYDRNLKFKKNFSVFRKEKKSLEEVPGGEGLRTFDCKLVFKNKKNLHRLILNRKPREVQTSEAGERSTHRQYQGLTTDSCLFCKRVGPNSTHLSFPQELRSPWERIPTSNCKTKNLVYLAGCRDCGKVYVGETGGQLKDRCNRHAPQAGDASKLQLTEGKPAEREALLKKWTAVRTHFAETGHNCLFAAPLHVMPSEATDLQRKKVELNWINKFKKNPVTRDRVLNF